MSDADEDSAGNGATGMDKLDSTDTLAQTKDGLQLRVSKGSDFTKNTNKVRIDLRYALGVMNPVFAGQGFG